MKIGFDAKRLFNNNTGLGNYARNLIKSIKQYYPEIEIHLFTPKVIKNEITKPFLNGDYFVHTKPNYLPASYWRIYGCSDKINSLQLNAYVGLSHEIPHGIHKSTKKIVVMHDLIWEKFPELFGKLNSLIYHYKYKSSCIRADQIISVSQTTKNDILNYYPIASSKIDVCYQSCDPIFQQDQNCTIFEERKYFLYVGTINERKSLLHAVEAFSELPHEFKRPFVVIGNGGAYLQKIKQRLSELQLNEWFGFKGNIPNTELLRYYDQAICLIMPSQYEGFGIPLIESLFRKTPCIISKMSAMEEAAGNGALIYNYGDLSTLTHHMKSIQKKENWTQLCEQGYHHVNSHFSTEKVVKNFVVKITTKQ